MLLLMMFFTLCDSWFYVLETERRVGKVSFPNYKRCFSILYSLFRFEFFIESIRKKPFAHRILIAHEDQSEVYESTNYKQPHRLVSKSFLYEYNHVVLLWRCNIESRASHWIDSIFAFRWNTNFQPLDSFDICFFCWFYRYHVDFNCFINFKINIGYCCRSAILMIQTPRE